MASGGNRKRNRRRTGTDRSLWGFLFKKEGDEQQDFTRGSFYQPEGEEDDTPRFSPITMLNLLWQKFNFWTTTAVLLFLTFTFMLGLLLLNMWIPQDMSDIAGYTDSGTAKDVTAIIRNANGREVTITEAELNRYLRSTCRLRQTGLFSIIAKCHGVGIRIHDGYMEIVIDRILGSNLHQTTGVHLSFSRKTEHGRPVLNVDFCGGEPLLGNMPHGGTIGKVHIPQHHIRMLKPALETLLACYPEISSIMEQYGYCPEFRKGTHGNDSTIRLVPYTFTSN